MKKRKVTKKIIAMISALAMTVTSVPQTALTSLASEPVDVVEDTELDDALETPEEVASGAAVETADTVDSAGEDALPEEDDSEALLEAEGQDEDDSEDALEEEEQDEDTSVDEDEQEDDSEDEIVYVDSVSETAQTVEEFSASSAQYAATDNNGNRTYTYLIP